MSKPLPDGYSIRVHQRKDGYWEAIIANKVWSATRIGWFRATAIRAARCAVVGTGSVSRKEWREPGADVARLVLLATCKHESLTRLHTGQPWRCLNCG